MRICAAQTTAVKGDITRNINRHMAVINEAVALDADIIVFPELSLTGYGPTLATATAAQADDSRFDIFQTSSDARRITICAGAPIKTPQGICISMLIYDTDTQKTIKKQFQTGIL
jgi:predicted amidohydrolase